LAVVVVEERRRIAKSLGLNVWLGGTINLPHLRA
jgi:hypothetical protein